MFAVLLSVGSQSQGQTNAAQNSGGAASPAGQRYRMVRAVSGTRGVERDGRFIIEDPRTVFHPSEDRKVIVEFEWEGPVGQHKFEALWKDPNGKVAVVSDFQFDAQKTDFTGYWTMLIDESAVTGFWTLEARIDGETAGSYSFEIASGAGTVPVTPTRIPLAAAEIYNRATAATVFVEKLDSTGKQIERSSGFLIGSDQVLTTFGNIDGASALRISFSDGKGVATSQVLSWDRLQDWAVLRVDAGSIPYLKLAPVKSWYVGEHCYSFSLSPAGGRVINQSTIVGHDSESISGERLDLSTSSDPSSLGAPAVDEFGEVIGILGTSSVTGLNVASEGGTLPPMAGSLAEPAKASVVPIDLVRIPAAGVTPATLGDLMAKGEFMPPLIGQDQVSFGALATGIDRKNGPGWPQNVRTQFSHADTQMVIFVTWDQKAKIKGLATLKFFSLDNKQLGETRSLKVNVRPGNFASSYWTVPITTFPAGTYRADVNLGDVAVWRQFFRILP